MAGEECGARTTRASCARVSRSAVGGCACTAGCEQHTARVMGVPHAINALCQRSNHQQLNHSVQSAYLLSGQHNRHVVGLGELLQLLNQLRRLLVGGYHQARRLAKLAQLLLARGSAAAAQEGRKGGTPTLSSSRCSRRHNQIVSAICQAELAPAAHHGC